MQNTCQLKDCPVAKKFKLKREEECPNFIESWWTPEGTKKPISVKDCASKRIFLMIQELYNRLIGVQQSQEQMRNAAEKDKTMIGLLTETIRLHSDKLLEQPHIVPDLKVIESKGQS